jgi:hypothetical protein
MSTLNEIEAAVDKLPPTQQEELLLSLTVRLRSRATRVPKTVSERRSVLEIAPVSLGEVLPSHSDDGDLLGDMLEGRV